jgi:rhodanese-related sulfurtransferase/DNA-binding transcriptional ArsR family regulator
MRDSNLHAHLARLGKALAAPGRITILDLLTQAPRTVERLAADSGQSVANTSQHLRVLREAQLVDAEKSGLYVTYRLAADSVAQLLVELRNVGEEQLAELQVARQALVEKTADIEEIDRDTLLQRMRKGEAILIDVRPHDEYVAGHLPGALSVPLAELGSRLADLPRGREIVAYCRGPYCMLAVEAVRTLARKGRRARRLEDGVTEWRAAGLKVVAGDRPRPRRSR